MIKIILNLVGYIVYSIAGFLYLLITGKLLTVSPYRLYRDEKIGFFELSSDERIKEEDKNYVSDACKIKIIGDFINNIGQTEEHEILTNAKYLLYKQGQEYGETNYYSVLLMSLNKQFNQK